MSKVVRVGFISRVDALNAGSRKGLWELIFSIFRHFGVNFITLNGGLISNKDFRKRLKAALDEAFEEWLETPQRERERKADLVARVMEQVKNEVAAELAADWPHLAGENGEPVKTYVVTAPAMNYDSAVGAEIASVLGTLRPDDIVFWGEEDQRFPIRIRREDGTEMEFEVVLPTKAAWRSKYFSTRPQRLVEDKEKQSAQRPPELWVSDCTAVGLVWPAAGERSVPIFSFPGAHRLQDVTASENQIGVGIVEFSDDGAPKAWIVSLKDLVSSERSHVAVAANATSVQGAIVEQLKKKPSTIGMLESATGVDREAIKTALDEYEAAGLEPRIVFDDPRKIKYDFDRKWLQNKLVYPGLDLSTLSEDVIAGFSCLHAGYRTTQYGWWVNRVPALLLRYGVKTLVCCGDKIAGLKHNLHLRGEILAGLNYTQQERLAAYLEGYVIFEVFKPRFNGEVERFKGRPNAAQLAAMIDASLLDYFHYLGNHDGDWMRELGVKPYETFTPTLIGYLTDKITSHIAGLKLGFPKFPYVRDIVEKHIVFGPEHMLPSGLRMGINHPRMARAQTASLRAQQVLANQRNCNIVEYGNFHTAKAVWEWEYELGERVAVENASILSGTEFEDGKLKTVDTAVSFLKAYSKDGRIIMTQAFFESPRPDEIKEYGEDDLLEGFIKNLGV